MNALPAQNDTRVEPDIQSRRLREIKHLTVGHLLIDRSYQREPSDAFIRKIASEFDPAKFGEIEVNIRPNGEIVIIDGQHRVAAIKTLVENTTTCSVPCIINRVASVDEEAILYLSRNHYIRQANSASTFQARLMIGDQLAVTTNEAILRAGYEPFTASVRTVVPPGLINAVACENVIRHWGAEVLDLTLKVLRRSYRDEFSFQTKFISGLASFIGRFRNDDAFSMDHLVKVLSATPPDTVIRRAQNSRVVLNLTNEKGMLLAFHYVYNHKRQNRLPPVDL